MSKQYVIVATDKRIVAVNPETRNQLQIVRADDILDVHVSNRGIFHARREETTNSKKVREEREDWHGEPYTVDVVRKFPSAHVVMYDSCSGRSVRTAYPAKQREMLLEERDMPLEFSFDKDGDSLVARLNGQEQVVFDRINGEVAPEAILTAEGNEVYALREGAKYGRVAKVREPVKFAACIDARAFEKMAKRKSPRLYEKAVRHLR